MIKTILTFLMLISACFTKAQTIEELRDSMAAGNLNMQVLLGIRYLDGDGVAEDSKEGLRLIQDAADKGNRFGDDKEKKLYMLYIGQFLCKKFARPQEKL